MTWPVSTDPQDSDALKWFLEKVPVVKEVWDSMSQEARRKAFTAAGVAHADLLTQVHTAIAKALKDGTALAQFKKDVRAKLLSAWGEQVANPAWRIETIFRTNVQRAYASGRWKQLNHPTIRKVRPFMMFDAVMDNRVSHICEKLDGTILPTEEWEKRGLIPPLHFNCRSALRSLRKSQALKQEKFGQDPPDVQAQDGFGNPLSEYNPLEKKVYPPAIREKLQERIRAASGLGPMSIPEGSSVKLSQQDVDAVFDEAQQIALKNVRPSGLIPSTKKIVLSGKDEPAGVFQPNENGGIEHVGVHEKCTEPLFTALHEIGHVFDHQGHESPGQFFSTERFGKVFELAKDTNTFAVLKTEVGKLSLGALRIASGQGRRGMLTKLAETKCAHEVFARVFSQWVAKRSGNAKLLEEFERARVKEPGMFWTDAEFSAISKAFEKYLRKIGWVVVEVDDGQGNR